MGNHGGRGKEGHPGNSDFDAHKAEALGFHIEPPDPLEAQLTYISGDKRLFPSGELSEKLKKLHPQMDVLGIQELERRVLSMRYPEQTENPKKL